MTRVATLPAGRRPGLDLLRGGVALAVLGLHAAVPYVAHPLPGLTWPTRHPAPSPWLDLGFWGAYLLVMPLFFWLSGYGSQRLLDRDGVAEFLRGRWRRIGRPGLLFATLLLPIELYLWVGGWILDGLIPPVKLWSLKLGVYEQGLWGPSNLWYLQYLGIYVVLWAGWRHLARPMTPRIMTGEPSGSWWRPLQVHAARLDRRLHDLTPRARFLLVWFLGVVGLWWRPEIQLGFTHDWWPDPLKLLWLGSCFLLGAHAARQPDGDVDTPEEHTLTRDPSKRMVIAWWLVAAPLTMIYLGETAGETIHPRLNAIPSRERLTEPFLALLACSLAGAILTTIRVVGTMALRHRRPIHPAARYLAEASYWIYLVHHTLVAACHLGLARTAWSAEWQCLISAATTLSLCLLGYHFGVRRTFVGRFLTGHVAEPKTITVSPVANRQAA